MRRYASQVSAPHDILGRPLRDLRISITDRCNFRCVYCMPKEVFGRDYAPVAVADADKGIRAVVVDEWQRATVPNIYAVGDVTNRINLTPVAIAEGQAVADLLFGSHSRIVDHESVPSAVFSQPPIATVGLTETEARSRYGTVEIYKSVFRPLKHTLSGRDERALMKLVVEPKSGRVIGAHMLGPEAAEIIQGLAIALKCGATKAQFDATIGIHPTAAEEFVTLR